MNTPSLRLLRYRYVRLLLVAIGVVFCIWAIKTTASYGISRLFSRSALTLRNLAAVQAAINLTPADPHAHRTNAALLSQMDNPSESVIALEQAIALRPSDYSLWLALGLLRDRIGDSAGALVALDEAVQRAPYYAHPRWHRGNVLLRAGQYEAAFSDLNIAAQSNPELLPNLIDLAWGVTRGDPKLLQELIEIRNAKARIAFARFLASHGRPVEALEQSRAAGSVDETTRREFMKQLLEKRNFTEAYQIWAGTARGTPNTTLHDGGFEATLSTNEAGFGWRVPAAEEALTLSVDPNQPHSGAKSLRIEFAGDYGNSLVLSQLLLVQPSTRYRISFAGRSRDIVTGGRPIAVVTDAGVKALDLGQSLPLDKGTTDWRPFSVEFTTTPETHAVFIGIRREQCTSGPCPIFGSIGLDSFSIEHLR